MSAYECFDEQRSIRTWETRETMINAAPPMEEQTARSTDRHVDVLGDFVSPRDDDDPEGVRVSSGAPGGFVRQRGTSRDSISTTRDISDRMGEKKKNPRVRNSEATRETARRGCRKLDRRARTIWVIAFTPGSLFSGNVASNSR